MCPSPIDVDAPCKCCGYNLRGLDPEGKCPECSKPIGWSLDMLRECPHCKRLSSPTRLFCEYCGRDCSEGELMPDPTPRPYVPRRGRRVAAAVAAGVALFMITAMTVSIVRDPRGFLPRPDHLLSEFLCAVFLLAFGAGWVWLIHRLVLNNYRVIPPDPPAKPERWAEDDHHFRNLG